MVHQKVHDARVNAVDLLSPGCSSRKQYSNHKEMLIFNLVSRYAHKYQTNKTRKLAE